MLPIRPFADHALELSRHGLAVIPCPGSDGKSPKGGIGGFHKWKRPLGPKAIRDLQTRFGDANVGIITSLSGVTVVDVDGDDNLTADIVNRIGATPLVTRTPSGGQHLWYLSNGERNANLRSLGWSADVKGCGAGVVIVPPSRRLSTGAPYTFKMGSWDDLQRLPTANLDKLLKPNGRFSAFAEIRRGRRNQTLFRFALREAPNCDDDLALLDVVVTANEQLPEPLPTGEVMAIARSAWNYQSTGRNWVGRESRVVIPQSVTELFIGDANGPDALLLFMFLNHAHAARARRGEAFAISPHGLSENGRLGWSPSRIRRARDHLLSLGLVECIHFGGRGTADPHLFKLRQRGTSGYPM